MGLGARARRAGRAADVGRHGPVLGDDPGLEDGEEQRGSGATEDATDEEDAEAAGVLGQAREGVGEDIRARHELAAEAVRQRAHEGPDEERRPEACMQGPAN